jgi:iron complex outermembrane receptor protein
MKRNWMLATALTFAWAHPALPQEEPPPKEDQEEPEKKEELTYAETVIVTASKVEQQLINSPAAVSVVTSEAIESSPASNYGDLLRSVPGVNVAQTSARDINIVTRGATSTLSTSQLALLDGRTIYQDFFGFVAWDFLPVDTSEIAQIEVIRGPASAVWGANAMTGVVNVITKTPRQIDGTTLTLAYGGVNRDVAGSDQDSGETYNVHLTHAQALNDRWAYKISAGVFNMEAFARPTGRIPVDLERGTGGGEYPPFPNTETTQPKLDARVDYDFPDGNQKLIFAGGFAGTQGIIHTGIGPFDIQSGTVSSYGKVNYERGNWKVNFFTNLLDGEAPALLAVGTDGRPITFLFDNKTYDVEVGNSTVLASRHILTYGGNFRYNAFDLSIAPRGDNRTEGGFYIQDEIFLSEHFRWLVGGRADAFSVIDKVVFSPRTTFMIKPTPEHAFRVSYNKAFRAPSFVNSFLDVTIVQAIDLGLLNPALAGRQYAFPVVAVGNEELNEESLTAYEVGYTGTLANRYTVSAAWYFNQTSDNIFFTQSGTYSSRTPPPGWPLPPVVLDQLILAGRGLPSGYTYLNFEGVRDWGIELGLDARVSSDVSLFANYSWQAEPDPDNPEEFSELNIPPANRFNVGASFSRGRLFGNVSFNYTDSAFWTDVLDARYHGPTESYAMLNGGFGVRLLEDRITAAIKVVNLNNDDAQQHVFGDIIKRQVVAELKYRFR